MLSGINYLLLNPFPPTLCPVSIEGHSRLWAVPGSFSHAAVQSSKYVQEGMDGQPPVQGSPGTPALHSLLLSASTPAPSCWASALQPKGCFKNINQSPQWLRLGVNKASALTLDKV